MKFSIQRLMNVEYDLIAGAPINELRNPLIIIPTLGSATITDAWAAIDPLISGPSRILLQSNFPNETIFTSTLPYGSAGMVPGFGLYNFDEDKFEVLNVSQISQALGVVARSPIGTKETRSLSAFSTTPLYGIDEFLAKPSVSQNGRTPSTKLGVLSERFYHPELEWAELHVISDIPANGTALFNEMTLDPIRTGFLSWQRGQTVPIERWLASVTTTWQVNIDAKLEQNITNNMNAFYCVVTAYVPEAAQCTAAGSTQQLLPISPVGTTNPSGLISIIIPLTTVLNTTGQYGLSGVNGPATLTVDNLGTDACHSRNVSMSVRTSALRDLDPIFLSVQ